MKDRIINDCQEPKPEPGPKLMPLEEWLKHPPLTQGYIHYMQAEWPGSPLPKECPYAEGTPERKQFDRGAQSACIDVQDCDDD